MDGLGSFIKETRLGCFDRNVTLNDVSKHSGISQPYLSMVENEKKIPTVKTFFKIIETLARFGDNLYLGELDQ
ncbi:helix-turn-helix transcriptional regulator, partial [Enterococcus hirae]|nr:helix-turn-helix transcriptional regulator [Enterococcus hirae]